MNISHEPRKPGLANVSDFLMGLHKVSLNMNIRNLPIALLLILPFQTQADDTVGYVKMSDLKAFTSHLSIYLEDGQTHTCAAAPTGRFHSEIENAHLTSVLLTALTAEKGVRLQYNCINNEAVISGVRLKSNL